MQLDSFTSTQSINTEIDGQETTTEIPNIGDNVVLRNENEIVKFSPPISTSIIDDSISDVESSSYASYIVPLKIILPVEHVHKTTNNSYERFNYILLKIDDASYHEHIYSDNSDFLLPVVRNTTSPTAKPVFDIENTTEIVTSTPNLINSNGREMIIESPKNDDTDLVLVDSQGYRYELGKHFQILDDESTSIVEFDEIAMLREKFREQMPTKSTPKPISKRILINDDEIKATTEPQKINLPNEPYEGHYAQIFQWLHYRL